MLELRQSTAVIVKVGPVVVATTTNILVPVTTVTISGADEAELLKAGTTGTLAISGTLTAITNCDGWYYLTLASSDVDVLGPLQLTIQDDDACLPFGKEFEIVTQNYYDAKYNSTGAIPASLASAVYASIGAFKADVSGLSTFDPAVTGVTLASAVYDSIGAFKATGFSTFDPATQGVTLTSATYTSITDFQGAVGTTATDWTSAEKNQIRYRLGIDGDSTVPAATPDLSTFDPTTQGVSLGSAIYASIGAFKADVSGLSTFDPAVTGVTLASAAYTSIGAFKADVSGLSTFNPTTQGVTLTSAIYDSIGSFKADVSGLSTFDPSTQGVTLTSATYTSADSFKADVSGLSTFDPATQGVSLGGAIYTSIGAFKADVSALATTANITALNNISVADIIAGVSDGSYDLQEMLRLIVAACVGKISGGSTTTITIRDLADTKNRIVATVDENGNRPAVTLDAS